MPHWSYKEFAPYKVVRCRFFDSRGRPIHPYCADGGFCRKALQFLHPHDASGPQKGWPGLDPKPSYRLDEAPFLSDSSPSSRKRARSPFHSPRRPISPQRYRERRGRSYSPDMALSQSYDGHRCNPIARRNSYREPSPVYRRERSPRLMCGNKRIYPRLNITGANTISLRSPRSTQPRLSLETSRISSSPELQTPSECSTKNARFPQVNDEYDLGDMRNEQFEPSEDAREGSFAESSSQPKKKVILNSCPSHNQGSASEGVTMEGIPATPSLTYVPSSPKVPIAPDGSSNIMKLINQLTKVHLRLLDNRKTYEDESVKLQAFESLAAKFDIPTTLVASVSKLHTPSTVSTFAPFGSAFITSATRSNAFDAMPAVGESEGPSKINSKDSGNEPHGRSSSLPSSGPKNIGLDKAFEHNNSAYNNEGLSTQDDMVPSTNSLDHNYGASATPGHSTEENGHKAAHQAILETLNGIRERREKIGQRVCDDFEEMANVLQTIWMGTFDVRATVTGADRPTSNVEINTTKDASPNQHHELAATSAIAQPSISAGRGFVTASDDGGKVLKRMRRVSFDDEVGTSEQEKELLRRMEEKIAGMERKLAKLVSVEKENVKMKAELKTQKAAMESIIKAVEGQAKVVDKLIKSRSSPNHRNANAGETMPEAAAKSS